MLLVTVYSVDLQMAQLTENNNTTRKHVYKQEVLYIFILRKFLWIKFYFLIIIPFND